MMEVLTDGQTHGQRKQFEDISLVSISHYFNL